MPYIFIYLFDLLLGIQIYFIIHSDNSCQNKTHYYPNFPRKIRQINHGFLELISDSKLNI